MFRNKIILVLLIVVVSISLLCCTSGNNDESNNSQNQVKETRSGEYVVEIKLTKDCIVSVKKFEGEFEYSGRMRGHLVVVGNEPFTRLVFMENKKDEDKDVNTYRIAEKCSKLLWDYQAIDVMIEGKVKTDYLETITGQKMKVMTLYPTNAYMVSVKEEDDPDTGNQ